jgi:photosystem II stability/assembly factor-like uncharacterized protein
MDGILLVVAVLCAGAGQTHQSGQTVRFYIEPPRKISDSNSGGGGISAAQPKDAAAQSKDPKLIPPEKPIYPPPRPGQPAAGSKVQSPVSSAGGGYRGEEAANSPTDRRIDSVAVGATIGLPLYRHELLDDARLNDVYFIDAQRGWAVGDWGVIWHTEDGGRQWHLQHLAVDCSLHSVFFIDEKTGWAAGGYTHPYTHTSRGILLFTRDGGRCWQLHDKLLLPSLRRIRFFDSRRGWAIAARCDLFPAGLFFTSDGGLSWSPSGGGAGGDWTCGDMFSPGNGALAGRFATAAAVGASALQLVPTDISFFQQPRQLRFFGPNRGWLVGDGGLVRSTSDQGQTWQKPQRLPPSLAQFDLAAVAIRHQKVWMAGTPGTRIWHSPDGGRTWQWSASGIRTPLRAICFADDQHGWAVGSLGTILATTDGGRSWRVQRAGASRVAVLALVAQMEDAPLELLARLSGDEGYLSAVEVLHRRDWQSPWDMAVASAERLHEAVAAVGCCDSALAWQFPAPAAELRLPAARILDAWDELHQDVFGVPAHNVEPPTEDGNQAADRSLAPAGERALRALRAHLVRQIRMWRPEIIITNDAAPQGDDPLRHLVNQAVLQAVYEAADRQCFAEQIDQASLDAWEVKKVYAALQPNDRGGIELNTSQLALRLGCSIAEATLVPRGLLHGDTAQWPQRVGFRLLVNNLPRAESQRDRDITSGIELPPGGDGRRRLAQAAVENLAALQRLAQQRRNMQAIIQQMDGDARGGANLLGQLGEMTLRQEPTAAAQILYQLAERYRSTGRWDLAADCFWMLAQRYPDHPLAARATVWLVQFYSSSEAGWRLRNPHRSAVRLVSTWPSEPQPVEALGPLGKPGNAPEKALALGEMLESTRPELAAMPSIVFPLAAAARNGASTAQQQASASSSGMGLQATAVPGGSRSAGKGDWVQRIAVATGAGRSDGDPWQQCRLGEQWIAARRGQPPKRVIKCVKASAKPRLDGRLDDAVWQAAEPAELASPYGDDQTWPATVALAYDAEFLYLAITCRFAPGLKYPPANSPRTRDSNLAANDRVELFLDVDRDYATFYRLAVDYRGFTAEECWGDASWNPTWFVAAARDQDAWCVEAAIPIVELVPAAPRSADVWAIGVQRVIPGVGLQSVHEPAKLPYAPECCCYLVFQ